MKNKGFTMVEMIFCISVILIILMLVIPNITQKNRFVKEKGCEAQLEVINSQILLYEVENEETPTTIEELIEGGYITKKQAVCPSGNTINIDDGQAYTD